MQNKVWILALIAIFAIDFLSLAAMPDQNNFAESLKSALVGFRNGTIPWSKLNSEWSRTCNRIPKSEMYNILLTSATEPKDPEKTAIILQLIYNSHLRYEIRENFHGQKNESVYNLVTHAEMWKKLLDDEYISSQLSWIYPACTNGMMAGMIIDSICTSDNNQHNRRTIFYKSIDRERLKEWLNIRAQLRLAGKPEKDLPQFPDPLQFDEATQNAIFNLLLQIPMEEVESAIHNMSYTDLVALHTIIVKNKGTELEKSLYAKLYPVRNKITQIFGAPDDFPLSAGRQLTIDDVKDIISYCKKKTIKDAYIRVVIMRQGFFSGFIINVFSTVPLDPSHDKISRPRAMTNPVITPCVGVRLNLADNLSDCIWEAEEKDDRIFDLSNYQKKEFLIKLTKSLCKMEINPAVSTEYITCFSITPETIQ